MFDETYQQRLTVPPLAPVFPDKSSWEKKHNNRNITRALYTRADNVKDTSSISYMLIIK